MQRQELSKEELESALPSELWSQVFDYVGEWKQTGLSCQFFHAHSLSAYSRKKVEIRGVTDMLPLGDNLLAVISGNIIRIVELMDDGTFTAKLSFKSNTNYEQVTLQSATHDLLICINNNDTISTIATWNWKTGKCLDEKDYPQVAQQKNEVQASCPLPLDQVATIENGKLHIYEPKPHLIYSRVNAGDIFIPFNSIAYLTNGHLLTNGYVNSMRFITRERWAEIKNPYLLTWDLESLRCIKSEKQKEPATKLINMPDGRVIAAYKNSPLSVVYDEKSELRVNSRFSP